MTERPVVAAGRVRHLLVVGAALVVLLSACGGSDADDDGAGANGCEQVEAPAPKSNGGAERPKTPLAPGKRYELLVETNCGSFTIELDQKSAPRAVASLASLTRAGFFDDTVFHRIVPGFVIQGGDPTASGMGGPGYQTVDRPPANARYTRGVVAMAKAPNEPAGTAGSQFFVVTASDAQLSADYAIVGRIGEGLDVVARIGRLGDPRTEQPTQPVVIESVRLEER